MNPALDSHREVLKRIITEEEKAIEDNYKGSFAQATHGGQAWLEELKRLRKMREGKADVPDMDMSADSDLDESDSSEEEEQEVDFDADGINKPVSRLKKLTKNQRNQKKERAGRNKAQNQAAHERKMAKQYDRI